VTVAASRSSSTAEILNRSPASGPQLWDTSSSHRQRVSRPGTTPKAVKNRLHLDISVSGGRAFPIETRCQRVDAEAERLAGLGASYVRVPKVEGLDHYGIAMQDPEGNELDIN
jgi:hypothetical protein